MDKRDHLRVAGRIPNVDVFGHSPGVPETRSSAHRHDPARIAADPEGRRQSARGWWFNDHPTTPGNQDAQMWTRDLGDGTTEVVTVSWWEDLDSIRGFAGDDFEAAVFYPEDDDFLVDRETRVAHFDVHDEICRCRGFTGA
jgi:heme-degrading monooxygenase HmoA